MGGSATIVSIDSKSGGHSSPGSKHIQTPCFLNGQLKDLQSNWNMTWNDELWTCLVVPNVRRPTRSSWNSPGLAPESQVGMGCPVGFWDVPAVWTGWVLTHRHFVISLPWLLGFRAVENRFAGPSTKIKQSSIRIIQRKLRSRCPNFPLIFGGQLSPPKWSDKIIQGEWALYSVNSTS